MGRLNARLERPTHVAFLSLVGICLVAAFLLVDGSATRAMILHAMTMTVLAPLAVAALHSFGWLARAPMGPLAATAVQSVLFVAWHTPALMSAAMHNAVWSLAMLGSLFAAAVAFWASICKVARAHPWSAIAALIFSGKLFCLISVLMVFAPTPAFHDAHGTLAAQLVDQQAAGLVMLAVCPLIYVAMAVSLAASSLSEDMTTSRNAPSAGAPPR